MRRHFRKPVDKRRSVLYGNTRMAEAGLLAEARSSGDGRSRVSINLFSVVLSFPVKEICLVTMLRLLM